MNTTNVTLTPCERATLSLLDDGKPVTSARAAWFKHHWIRLFDQLSDPVKVSITQFPLGVHGITLRDNAWAMVIEQEESKRLVQVTHDPAFLWWLGFAVASAVIIMWIIIKSLS